MNAVEYFKHPSLAFGNELIAWLEAIKHPVLQLARPKDLRVPAGYVDPRYFITQCYATSLLMKTEPDAASNKTLVTGYAVSNLLMRYQVPTFFVGGDLLCALAASDPPEDLLVSELSWPAKAMLLMLPTELSRQVVAGHEVVYIALAHGMQTMTTCAPFDVVVPEHMGGGRFPPRIVDIHNDGMGEWLMLNAVVVDRDGGPCEYHAVLPITGQRVKDWALHEIVFYPFATSAHPQPFDQVLDGEVAARLRQIVIQVMLAFNAKPELLERETVLRPAKKDGSGKVLRRALWQPNFIGRTYVLPRTKGDAGGAHASPRAHYRRGHFRNQAFGPRTAPSHRLLWIEPMLIGAGV